MANHTRWLLVALVISALANNGCGEDGTNGATEESAEMLTLPKIPAPQNILRSDPVLDMGVLVPANPPDPGTGNWLHFDRTTTTMGLRSGSSFQPICDSSACLYSPVRWWGDGKCWSPYEYQSVIMPYLWYWYTADARCRTDAELAFLAACANPHLACVRNCDEAYARDSAERARCYRKCEENRHACAEEVYRGCMNEETPRIIERSVALFWEDPVGPYPQNSLDWTGDAIHHSFEEEVGVVGVPRGSGINVYVTERKGLQPQMTRVELVSGRPGDWQPLYSVDVSIAGSVIPILVPRDILAQPGKRLSWRIWDAYQRLDLNPHPGGCWPSGADHRIVYHIGGRGERTVSAIPRP